MKNKNELSVRYPLPYKVVDGNLFIEITDKHSKYDKKLCNFTPYIKSEITVDDGAEEKKLLRIGGERENGESLPCIEISASELSNLNWIIDKWGPACILEVGHNIKELLRYFIQQTSLNAKQEYVYQQTGWKKINGEWYFLLPGNEKFEVSLKGKLQSYCGENQYQQSDLETVYLMTEQFCAPKEVVYVLLAFTFLTPLNEFLRQTNCMPKFVLNIIGRTGTRKSSIAALFLSFFGMFGNGNLPMSFRDTANSIIHNTFALKDVLTCIDDFHPSGKDEEKKLNSTMQAIVRAYGDRTGRGRLRSDSSLMESRPPLGNAIITSEYAADIGESGTARYFLLELKDGDVDLENLSFFQQRAEQGDLRRAMYAYTEWIRKFFLKDEKGFIKTLKDTFEMYRTEFVNSEISCHGRVPEMIAELRIGMKMLSLFFQNHGIISKTESDDLNQEFKDLLYSLAKKQSENIKNDKPTVVFVKKLYSLIESGEVSVTNKELQMGEDPYPHNFIGFEYEQYLYLNKDMAYRYVKKLCNDQGENFSLTCKALLKNLAEEGLIKTSSGSNTVSVRYAGKNRRYIALDKLKADKIVDGS